MVIASLELCKQTQSFDRRRIDSFDMRSFVLLLLTPSIAVAGVLRVEFSDYMESLNLMNHYLGFDNKEMACTAANEADSYLKSYLFRFQQQWPDIDWDKQQAGVKTVVDYCKKIGF